MHRVEKIKVKLSIPQQQESDITLEHCRKLFHVRAREILFSTFEIVQRESSEARVYELVSLDLGEIPLSRFDDEFCYRLEKSLLNALKITPYRTSTDAPAPFFKSSRDPFEVEWQNTSKHKLTKIKNTLRHMRSIGTEVSAFGVSNALLKKYAIDQNNFLPSIADRCLNPNYLTELHHDLDTTTLHCICQTLAPSSNVPSPATEEALFLCALIFFKTHPNVPLPTPTTNIISLNLAHQQRLLSMLFTNPISRSENFKEWLHLLSKNSSVRPFLRRALASIPSAPNLLLSNSGVTAEDTTRKFEAYKYDAGKTRPGPGLTLNPMQPSMTSKPQSSSHIGSGAPQTLKPSTSHINAKDPSLTLNSMQPSLASQPQSSSHIGFGAPQTLKPSTSHINAKDPRPMLKRLNYDHPSAAVDSNLAVDDINKKNPIRLRHHPPTQTDNGRSTPTSNVTDQKVYGAGIILLWPLLPGLFEKLGLVSEGNFIDLQAQMNAAYWLDQLTWDDLKVEEWRTPLHKLLCGLPLEFHHAWIQIPPNKAEVIVLRRWLETIGQQIPAWRRLTQVDIRNLFLQRQGVLTQGDQCFELYIRSEPFDLLLSEWPWPVTTLFLPWLSKPFSIHWEKFN